MCCGATWATPCFYRAETFASLSTPPLRIYWNPRLHTHPPNHAVILRSKNRRPPRAPRAALHHQRAHTHTHTHHPRRRHCFARASCVRSVCACVYVFVCEWVWIIQVTRRALTRSPQAFSHGIDRSGPERTHTQDTHTHTHTHVPEPAPAAQNIEENATLVQPACWEAPKCVCVCVWTCVHTRQALDEDINCFIDASGARLLRPPARRCTATAHASTPPPLPRCRLRPPPPVCVCTRRVCAVCARQPERERERERASCVCVCVC